MQAQATDRPWSLPDVSRRTFLKGGAGSMAALVVLAAHDLDARAQDDPALTGFSFFNTAQAATVDALAEQFWPTTPESAGGSAAGVVYYIDRALSGAYMDHQRVYLTGLAMLDDEMRASYGGAFTDLDAQTQLDALVAILDPPNVTTSGGTPAATPGATPAATPASGVDTAAEGRPIGAATPAPVAADEVAEDGTPIVAGLDGPTVMGLGDFLDIVRVHTMEGLFSDPVYGGNRDFAGWAAVGYPGPYYIYTEEQQQSFEPLNQPFQSIADL
jgi:gluconate 2-dehydrogenase gamma chain